MGDSFTNFLLVTLITLIGFIAKVAFDKFNEIFVLLRTILVSNEGKEKEILQLRRDWEDHENRINDYEKRIQKLEK